MNDNQQKKSLWDRYGEFIKGENHPHGKAQMKAFHALGSFLGSLIMIALIIGGVVAFGVWALAVVVIIIAISVFSGKKAN